MCSTPLSTFAQTSVTLTPSYLYPKPAAQRVSPGAAVAVRFTAALQPAALTVGAFHLTGSRSGRIAGKATLADDGRTLSFIPRRPFIPGEEVAVIIDADLPTIDASPTAAQSFTFTVSPKKYPYVKPAPIVPQARLAPGTVAPFVTAPASLPTFTITHGTQQPADGHIFLTTFFTPFPYLLILDSSGQLVWQRQMKTGRQYADFKPQPGGRLSYFDGVGTNYGGHGSFFVMNANYEIIDRWDAGNGYETDNHDLQLLPNGGAVLMVYDLQTVDMTPWGGKKNATVIETVIQELDSHRNVVFEWRSDDHVAYEETQEPLDGDLVDPTHGNSVDVLSDGDFLVSFRNISQVMRIDRETGDVVWRMGGKRNEFTFTDDPGFSYQHDARMHAGGRMSIFDNGNRQAMPRSRAVEYVIDEQAKTATRAWEFAPQPTLYNFFMGNVDRSADGSAFIGWGGPHTIGTEIAANGEKALELQLQGQGYVYRWHKEPWQSTPTTTPQLVVDRSATTPTLRMSWNGATNVSAWRIEAGANAAALKEILVAPKAGFETSAALEGERAKNCAWRVTALNAAGATLGISKIVQRCAR